MLRRKKKQKVTQHHRRKLKTAAYQRAERKKAQGELFCGKRYIGQKKGMRAKTEGALNFVMKKTSTGGKGSLVTRGPSGGRGNFGLETRL